MVGLAKACEAVLGTAQAVAGFTLAPTAPASLSAVLGPGQVFQQAQLEATPFSTLPADGHTVVKQGILIDAQTLTFTPPSASGYAQNFLVEVQYQDADAGATVLPYYNAGNPQVGFSGPGGAGTAQNTVRRGAVAYQIKAGVAATAGTQTSPAPDAGWAGLYVVTMAQGATTITAGNITLYAGAPFIPVTLPGVPRGVQSGQWEFGVASGTNAYTVALSPAPLARPQGMEILVYIPPGQANTGAATLNDGLGLVPFVRQGGGVLASGDVSGFVPIVFDGASWRVNGPVTSDVLALIYANAPRNVVGQPTVFVRTDGNDTTGDGSANDAAHAYLTINVALAGLATKFNLTGRSPLAQLGNAGTYVGFSVPAGIAAVTIQGDTTGTATAQDNYVISGSTPAVSNGALVTLIGAQLYNTSSTADTLTASGGGGFNLGRVSFNGVGGNTTGALINSFSGSNITISSGGIKLLISAGAAISASGGSIGFQPGTPIIMAGSLSFPRGYIVFSGSGANVGINLGSGGTYFAGTYTITGPKYNGSLNAVLNTYGNMAAVPGSTAGSTSTGAQIA